MGGGGGDMPYSYLEKGVSHKEELLLKVVTKKTISTTSVDLQIEFCCRCIIHMTVLVSEKRQLIHG